MRSLPGALWTLAAAALYFGVYFHHASVYWLGGPEVFGRLFRSFFRPLFRP